MTPASNSTVSKTPAAVLIVCERSGNWAAAWRRLLDGRAVRLVETRSLADCREALAELPAATVAIELTAVNTDDALACLASVEREFPQAVVVVMAGREMVGYEALARELGAAWFVTSPRELPALVGLVRRHAAYQLVSEGTIEEQVMARLPWG